MFRLLLCSLVLLASTSASAERLLVATAANFKPTLGEIVSVFQQQTGHSVIVSSAATGVLYNQILHGAPFDLFLAGDDKHPRLLEQSGDALAGSRITYAYGNLVLAYRPQLLELASAGVEALLRDTSLNLVIANPEHAPYGEAAMSVLKRWPGLTQRRILRASNVGQAYQMWYSGGADLALVALSSRPANYLPIPEQWFAPIQQQAVILQRSAETSRAREFLGFLQTPAMQSLIRQQGYRTEPAANG